MTELGCVLGNMFCLAPLIYTLDYYWLTTTNIEVGWALAYIYQKKNLDDIWSTLASTLTKQELKQALNHSWHAWIRVVWNAAKPKPFKTNAQNTCKNWGSTAFHPLYANIYVYVCRYVCMCIHTYTYIYINTWTYKNVVLVYSGPSRKLSRHQNVEDHCRWV